MAREASVWLPDGTKEMFKMGEDTVEGIDEVEVKGTPVALIIYYPKSFVIYKNLPYKIKFPMPPEDRKLRLRKMKDRGPN